MRSPEELTLIFRAQGLKITPQRQSIFRALHGSTVHPTAEAVFDTVRREMPAISAVAVKVGSFSVTVPSPATPADGLPSDICFTSHEMFGSVSSPA